MRMELSAYTAVYVGATLVALTVALFTWERRRSPGGRWLILMLLATAQWSLSDALDLSSVALQGHVFWAKWSYVGATTAPIFLLLFALEYTGHRRAVTPAFVMALFVIPVGSTIATFFNELHMLTWTGFTPAPQNPSLIVYAHGPLYWFTTAYLSIVLFVATALLVTFAIRNKELYAYQSVAIIVATLIPWVALMIYDFFPELWPGVDPSASIVATAVILAVGLFRFRLLDLAPVAREVLVEKMRDGLLVFDSDGCLVDLNPAARELIAIDRPVGRKVGEIFGDGWPRIAGRLSCSGSAPVEFVDTSPGGRDIRVSVLPLRDALGRRGGCLVTFDDVTDRIATERALLKANEELTGRLAEIKALHADLAEQVIRDPLTGLFNRRYLDETIHRELGRAEREGYPVGIVMIDIDHFKRVNDESGHASGDMTLKLLASQLALLTRPGDIACRYGGDEFVLVLTNTTTRDAFKRAEEWRERFNTASAGLTGVRPATLSLGVASFPVDGSSAAELIAAADRAVYAAKKAGRNRTLMTTRHGNIWATS